VAEWAEESARANRELSLRMNDLTESLVDLAARVSEPPVEVSALEGTLAAMPQLPVSLDEMRRSLEVVVERLHDLARAVDAGSEVRVSAERRTRAALDRLEGELAARVERLEQRIPD
jgi:hypothetical protein